MSYKNHNLYVPDSRLTIEAFGTTWDIAVPVIRQSVLKDFTHCQRLFLYRHVLGLTPKAERRSPAIDTGDFWHALMRHLYLLGGDYEAAVGAARAYYTATMEELGKFAAEDLTGEGERTMREVTASWNKAQVMAKLFWSRYPLSPSVKVIEAETPLAIQFGESGPIFQVTPDLLVEDAEGNLWIEDHKSSGDSPSALMIGKAWAYQTNLYRFVVELAKKMPVTGFIYNLMQAPGIKLCGTDEKAALKAKTTPEAAYLQRVAQWYNEKPEDHIKAAWIPASSMPATSVGAFRTTSTCALLGVQGLATGKMDFTGFTQDATCSSCQMYGRTCEFLGLCESDPASWKNQLSLFYTQEFPAITTPLVAIP